MDLSVSRQPVFINETLLDTGLEQAVECDVLLPDYLPDIGRILKCTLSPAILSSVVSQNRLVVEGVGQITLHYAPQGGGLRTVEYKVPFSRTVDLRSDAATPIVNCHATTDYINCRAVTARRLDFRGAVSMAVKVINVREETLVACADGCGVQLRRNARNCTRIVSQTTKSFSLSEELEIGYGKQPVGHILRVDTYPHLMDSRVVAGKVSVKGEVALKVLYQTTGDRCDMMEYALPINQMADIAGAEEGCTAHVSLHVCACTCEARSNSDGEDKLIAAEMMLSADIRVHKTCEVSCIADCYSTRYECTSQSKAVNLLRLVQVVEKPFVQKECLDLPEGCDEVIDCWARVESYAARMSEGCVNVTGRLCISLLYMAPDGQPAYMDKILDFEDMVTLPGDCENPTFEPLLRVVSCTYAMSAGRVELRCECQLSGCIYSHMRTQAICEINLDQRKEKQRPVPGGLYIYLADEGEGLWDIAKRYNTSTQYIMEENDMESENADGRTMLIIPVL